MNQSIYLAEKFNVSLSATVHSVNLLRVPMASKVFSLLGCQAKSAIFPIWDPGGWMVRSVTEASPSSWLTAQLIISRRRILPKDRKKLVEFKIEKIMKTILKKGNKPE